MNDLATKPPTGTDPRVHSSACDNGYLTGRLRRCQPSGGWTRVSSSAEGCSAWLAHTSPVAPAVSPMTVVAGSGQGLRSSAGHSRAQPGHVDTPAEVDKPAPRQWGQTGHGTPHSGHGRWSSTRDPRESGAAGRWSNRRVMRQPSYAIGRMIARGCDCQQRVIADYRTSSESESPIDARSASWSRAGPRSSTLGLGLAIEGACLIRARCARLPAALKDG